MTKTEQLLYNQARNEGLGYVENAIYHRHLRFRLPLRRLLFLGQENAGSNASPNVDLIDPQKELPSSMIDLGVLAHSTIDLPTEVQDEDKRSSKVLLEEIFCTRAATNRL